MNTPLARPSMTETTEYHPPRKFFTLDRLALILFGSALVVLLVEVLLLARA